MSDATCKTCPFFEYGAAKTLDGRPRGLCHHVAAEPNAENPERYADWWCSEHPLWQRDRLAAMAMQGMLAHPDIDFRKIDTAPPLLAQFAYLFADAMLAAGGA